MCVIIYREPNVEIPYQKLESACLVNADGMGIVTLDRGKLDIRKHFSKKGNDPELLAKALEDNKGLTTYVHLRYTTRGTTDRSNVHPFGVLTTKKHGMDVTFMHNGTLTDFGTKTVCDSRDFAKTLLNPLAEAFLKRFGENFLRDDVFNDIVSKYAGRNSVFLLADNLGNHTIINRKEGKEFEGWWASNEYSFNRYHRTPTTNSSSYGYSKGWERDYDGDYKKMYGNQAVSEAKEPKVVSLPKLPAPKPEGDTGTTSKYTFNDEVPFETAKEEASKEVTTKKSTFPQRTTFIELAGLTSMSDVCGLSKLEIEDMVEEFPDMATLLILDLLKELYNRDQEYDDTADYERTVA